MERYTRMQLHEKEEYVGFGVCLLALRPIRDYLLAICHTSLEDVLKEASKRLVIVINLITI